MNMNYRDSLKPHLTSSYASKSSAQFGWARTVGRGGGDDIIEMTQMYRNIQLNLFCVHLILRGCDPSDIELVITELMLQISYMI
jgi:hypothetical protein